HIYLDVHPTAGWHHAAGKLIVLAGSARATRPNPLGGPTHPFFTGGTSTFWAQEVNAGLELRFSEICRADWLRQRKRNRFSVPCCCQARTCTWAGGYRFNSRSVPLRTRQTA